MDSPLLSIIPSGFLTQCEINEKTGGSREPANDSDENKNSENNILHENPPNKPENHPKIPKIVKK